ncbi:hypothetical protein P8452_68801 [Trifolium repens]|nr:hypothetical protein P8452_68801 [Trifolium repens]
MTEIKQTRISIFPNKPDNTLSSPSTLQPSTTTPPLRQRFLPSRSSSSTAPSSTLQRFSILNQSFNDASSGLLRSTSSTLTTTI